MTLFKNIKQCQLFFIIFAILIFYSSCKNIAKNIDLRQMESIVVENGEVNTIEIADDDIPFEPGLTYDDHVLIIPDLGIPLWPPSDDQLDPKMPVLTIPDLGMPVMTIPGHEMPLWFSGEDEIHW